MAMRVVKRCRLEHEIASAGMTRPEFASAAGISLCYLCQIITMRRRPGKTVDKRIRETLHCWDDDLYSFDPDWEENRERDIVRNIRYWTKALADHKRNYGRGGENDEERAG